MAGKITEEKKLIAELELELTRYTKKVKAFKKELAEMLLEDYTTNWKVKTRASLRRAGLDLKNTITDFNKEL